jgi:6-phosphofructokinase 1
MKYTEKIFKGKTLAILSGGGDTPAINSSIEFVRNRASVLGFKVYGVQYGWKGLLGEGDIVDLSNNPYNGFYGGTALKSSRTNPFPSKKNPENRVPQILENLKKYKIDVIVTIGGDDTNGAAKRLYETEGIPVIGFPKTIDNDLRTKTIHNYNGKEIEAVLCPGFPSASLGIVEFVQRLKTTAESHSRIMVIEIMGRDAGWLTGSGAYGGCDIALVPEIEMTQERQEAFFQNVKEAYNRNPKKYLLIAVSEGVKWFDEKTGKPEYVYASSELDEFGHPRFGGISGIIASDITKNLKLEARAQITGYYPRAGFCREYDRKLTASLSDKVMDLLIREDYGKMPVVNKIVALSELEEFNTTAIDMGNIGNKPLPVEYYDVNKFQFTDAYNDFLMKIVGAKDFSEFGYSFPKIKI